MVVNTRNRAKQLSGGALGFARYETFTAKNGCPRCGGALFAGMCLMCGYDGPTRAPVPSERTRGARTPTKVSRHA